MNMQDTRRSGREAGQGREQGFDGNAVAGALEMALGHEVTTAIGTCAGCGHQSLLAEVQVFFGPAAVLRCRGCGSVLAIVSARAGYTCLDLLGLSTIEPPQDSPPERMPQPER